jgi:hypothetical protein
MKKVLSLLMAFVFLQAQTWALSGGPDFSTDIESPNSLIGTYGGVFIPQSSTVPNAGNGTNAPSIGIFSIAVTQTGIAAGNAIFFVRGAAFIGQIAAIADADKKQIDGVFGAQSNFDVILTVLTGTTTTVNANGQTVTTRTFSQQNYPVFAEGSFKMKVKEGDAGAFTTAPAGSGAGSSGSTTSTSSSTVPTQLEVGSTNSARLSGTALIDTFFRINGVTGAPIITETTTFAVDGIKQSNIPNVSTALTFNLGS